MLQHYVRKQTLPLRPALLSPSHLPRPPRTTTDAVKELCSKNKYTCWFGGKKDWETQCPLISAEGTLLKQGCGQVRSAGYRTYLSYRMLPPRKKSRSTTYRALSYGP